jgi:RimJ/RimL family protein N-acetyltransferase
MHFVGATSKPCARVPSRSTGSAIRELLVGLDEVGLTGVGHSIGSRVLLGRGRANTIHAMNALRTPRLVLRQWRPGDFESFAALNADPEVMRFFPAPMTREESDALAQRAERDIAERGWGLWAVEVEGSAPFIGFVGLAEPSFDAHFTPAVEAGWRLSRDQWGNGYATEAARAAVAFGFDELGLEEIVSFTPVANEPSRGVMERLGMTHEPQDDFDHPSVSDGPLRRHVLYRLRR